MDTASHWPHQDIVVKPIEEMVANSKAANSSSSVERKVRPQKEQALNCPRCNSTNTKFCYYNNYSLSQPRYFCKTCRRYWTEGGSLRNIPVGGGSRKNKRSSSISSSISSNPSLISKKLPDLVPPQRNPNKTLESQADLNLGFSSTTTHQDFKAITEMIQVPNYHENMSTKLELQNYPSSSLSRGTSLSSFLMPSHDPATVYSNNISSSLGFPGLLPEFKLCNFSLDGLGNGNGGAASATTGYGSSFLHHQGGVHEPANGKLLFPFEDLKQVSSANANHHDDDHEQQNRDSSNPGYWNGVIGSTGGSW